MSVKQHLGLLTALSVTTFCVPSAAQTVEELDAISDTTNEEESGIRFAEEQAARGEWLEAISTLERVLATNPKSRRAQLLRSLYLCRIDDRTGAAVEFVKIRKKKKNRELREDVRAQCGFARED